MKSLPDASLAQDKFAADLRDTFVTSVALVPEILLTQVNMRIIDRSSCPICTKVASAAGHH